MEVVHHGGVPTGEWFVCPRPFAEGADRRFPNSSITRSVRAARLPLMSTRSPGSAISTKISAASVVELTALLFPNPARSAAFEIAAATFPIAIK
jgi:hypothetical protein